MLLTDSIYSSGQEIMTPAAFAKPRLRSSLNHHAGNLSACGLVCRPQSFGVGIELCFYISVFQPPHLHHLAVILGDIFGVLPAVIALTHPSMHKYIRQPYQLPHYTTRTTTHS